MKFEEKLLLDLGMEINEDKINIIAESFGEENNTEKVREVFKYLLEKFGQNQFESREWYTMSKSQTMCALFVSKEVLQGMMNNGTAPSYFRTSAGSKSSIRFHMISVAEFLAKKG